MINTTPLRRLEIQLMVDHPRLKSADLEKFLMTPPDEQWNVGDSYRPSPHSPEQRYQFSRWALRSVATSLDQLADAIRALIHRIQPIKQNFKLLPDDATVSLTLFITETDSVIGMGIGAEAIEVLAQINAGIEVSLVVTQ